MLNGVRLILFGMVSLSLTSCSDDNQSWSSMSANEKANHLDSKVAHNFNILDDRIDGLERENEDLKRKVDDLENQISDLETEIHNLESRSR
jgi:archaellum component FlaC